MTLAHAVFLAKTRGPSFVSPAGPRIGDEPTATELVEVVDAFCARDELGSMGELDGGVVFQGEGEPLLRLPVILDTIRRVAEKRNGIPFRINTSGLVSCDEDIASLVAAMPPSGADNRRETRLDRVSVASMQLIPGRMRRSCNQPTEKLHLALCVLSSLPSPSKGASNRMHGREAPLSRRFRCRKARLRPRRNLISSQGLLSVKYL